MRCPKGEEISAYIDGELGRGRVAAVRAHIAACSSCGRLAQELQSTRSVLASQPQPHPMVGFTERTLRRYAGLSPDASKPAFASRRLVPWAGVALVLVCLSGGLLFARWRKPNDPLIARCLEYYEETAAQEQPQSALDDSSPWTAVLGEDVP